MNPKKKAQGEPGGLATERDRTANQLDYGGRRRFNEELSVRVLVRRDEGDIPKQHRGREETLEVSQGARWRAITVAHVRLRPSLQLKHFAWMLWQKSKLGSGSELLRDREFVLFGVLSMIVHCDLVYHFPRDSGASEVEQRGFRPSRYIEQGCGWVHQRYSNKKARPEGRADSLHSEF